MPFSLTVRNPHVKELHNLYFRLSGLYSFTISLQSSTFEVNNLFETLVLSFTFHILHLNILSPLARYSLVNQLEATHVTRHITIRVCNANYGFRCRSKVFGESESGDTQKERGNHVAKSRER